MNKQNIITFEESQKQNQKLAVMKRFSIKHSALPVKKQSGTGTCVISERVGESIMSLQTSHLLQNPLYCNPNRFYSVH